MWDSRRPPPFMEKTILNFHFDYLIICLRSTNVIYTYTALSAVIALRLVLLLPGFLPENHLLKIMRS